MSELRWVVAAAIVDDLDRPSRLFAARRTEPAWAAGLWELPGGSVEPGEDHEAALHRELAEELGVAVTLGRELLPDASDRSGWPIRPGYVMRVWWAQVHTGQPAALEDHDAVTWLDHGRWHDVPWLPSNAPIVRALAAEAAPSRARDHAVSSMRGDAQASPASTKLHDHGGLGSS